MPLLHKKPFVLEPPPADLRPDEEVFVCQATKEVFRDYEKFFNRHFLCNSLVWTCEYTGKPNLTYTQALESEPEARKLLDALPLCFQQAILSLVHHVRRTNVRTLVDELVSFYRERFIVGEKVDLVQAMPTGGRGSLTPVCVLKVFPPEHPKTPVKVPVIALSPNKATPPNPTLPIILKSPSFKDMKSDVVVDLLSPPACPNGDIPSTHSPQGLKATGASSGRRKSNPKTPSTPLSLESNLDPLEYKYVVQYVATPETVVQVMGSQLSRPKGIFTREKLRLFLRNALYKPTEKHPIMVKDECIQKFSLGPSTINLSDISPITPSSSKKRNLSQASLDNFFTPGSEPKKPRPMTLATFGKLRKEKKTPSRGGKSKKRSAKGSKKKSPQKSAKSPHIGIMSPKGLNSPLKTMKSPRSVSKMGALKLLNKAKKLKQMDLKKSVVRKGSAQPLTEIEVLALRQRAEEDHIHRIALREAEKQRKKEERLQKLKELHEQKRQEKLRQKEWMKPREDLLCEDSKPLPCPTDVSTKLPHELFGGTVMVMEFLHTFGPLFNIKEVIPWSITFDKLEYALLSSNIDTLLFDILKFLLQAIFAAKEEENELRVQLASGKKKAILEMGEGEGEKMEEDRKGEAVGTGQEEQRYAEEKAESEGDKRSDDGHLSDEEGEGEKRLDRRLENIKLSATTFSKWSLLTQSVPLHKLVLDLYTCSEVLMLHLLSSGGYSDSGDRSWFRHARRGGYTDADDAAIELRLNRPDIIDKLSHVAVYDLPAADKLEVLSTLCSQLLSYSVSRDHIEGAKSRAKKAQKAVREIHISEEKRKKEGKLEKARLKKKEKEKHKARSTAEGEEKLQSPENPKPVEGGKEVEDGIAETEEERKARIEEELKGYNEEISEASAVVNLRPLGTDRYRKRYWAFSSLPGLYVEKTSDIPPEAKEVTAESDSTTGEATAAPMQPSWQAQLVAVPQCVLELQKQLEDGMDISQAIQMIAMRGSLGQQKEQVAIVVQQTQVPSTTTTEPQGPSPAASMVEQPSGPQWSCYITTEEVDALISSLNLRGKREVELKKNLEAQKTRITRTISKCPFRPEEPTRASSSPSPQEKYRSADQYLELYLREQILDIEEKIYLGNLGYLKGVESRVQWRDAIETSGAAAALQTEPLPSALEVPTSEKQHSRSVSPIPVLDDSVKLKSGTMTPVVKSSVHQLSKALLQVQAGIEKKYLMPPLGMAVDEKKKKGPKKNGIVKESDLCLEQWRSSLAKATSFSQVFVHLATLERAVMWSKSLMNVRCRICRRKGGDEYMLLCDGCDHGYHMYCLRPPLTDVPEGDWFCYDCKPVTPVKRRRVAQRVVVIQEEESSESEVEEEPQASEDEDEDEEEDEETEEEGEEEEASEPEEENRRSLRSRTRRVTVDIRRSSRLQVKGRGKKAQAKATHKNKKGSRRVSFASQPTSSGKRTIKTPEMPLPLPESTRARKKLKLDELPASSFQSKAESVIAALIDLRCSQSKRQTSALKREHHGLEIQLCDALWEEVKGQESNWPFAVPVKKRQFPDYFDVIAHPMDLRTVKNKLNSRKYSGLDEFLEDMQLIFSNCTRYHKRHSEIGKAGATLKKFFEKRCSDLGLRDLNLCKTDVGGLHRSSSKRRH